MLPLFITNQKIKSFDLRGLYTEILVAFSDRKFAIIYYVGVWPVEAVKSAK